LNSTSFLSEAFYRDNVSRETMQLLEIYRKLLEQWQSKINLVSSSSLSHVWERHFEDSLQLLPLLPKEKSTLIDLGSGAGFPGLVLAIARRGTLDVSLVESDLRKCLFLENVARECQGVGTRVSQMQNVSRETFKEPEHRSQEPEHRGQEAGWEIEPQKSGNALNLQGPSSSGNPMWDNISQEYQETGIREQESGNAPSLSSQFHHPKIVSQEYQETENRKQETGSCSSGASQMQNVSRETFQGSGSMNPESGDGTQKAASQDIESSLTLGISSFSPSEIVSQEYQETGIRGQESGGRKQESGDRNQGPGRKSSENRKQKSGEAHSEGIYESQHLSPDACVLTPDSQHPSLSSRPLSPDSRHLTPDPCVLSPDACVLTPDSQHPSLGSRPLSLDSRHLTPVSCPLTPVSCPLTPVSCPLTPESQHPSLGSRPLSPDSRHLTPDPCVLTPDSCPPDSCPLSPVKVIHARIENLPSMTGDIITARGLAPLEELLSYAFPLMGPKSICLFLKGKTYEKEIEMAIKKWDFSLEIFPSLSDSKGQILKISHLKRLSA